MLSTLSTCIIRQNVSTVEQSLSAQKQRPFACVSISMGRNPLDDIAYKYLSYALDMVANCKQNQCTVHRDDASFSLITNAKLTKLA